MSRPDQSFGWRKRIGLLSPTVIETAAYDFFKLAPDGVSMCATTSNIEHWSKENFKEHVIDPLVTAVKYLASRHVDYIIHTGMPVVTTRGKGFEEELVKLITDTTGLPATTSIRSAIRALAHLGVRNVAVVTPYPQELHQSALTFLKASGFNVVAEHTEDVVFKQLQDVTPAHIAAATKKRSGKGAVGRRRLHPVQPVVRCRRRAADRAGMRRAGRDRCACRLLGSVPLARHQRPHRRPRQTDGEPEQRRARRSGARVTADISARRQ